MEQDEAGARADGQVVDAWVPDLGRFLLSLFFLLPVVRLLLSEENAGVEKRTYCRGK
jgi:hypothetical protein